MSVDVIDNFLSTKGKEHTYVTYKNVIMRFHEYLKSQGLDLLPPNGQDVEKYMQSIESAASAFLPLSKRKDEISLKTQKLRSTVIRSFYDTLDVQNPMRMSRSIRKGRKIIDSEIITRSLESLDKSTKAGLRDYALLCVMFDTGANLSQMALMRTGDILPLFESATILLPGRNVQLDKFTKDVLYDWLTAAHGSNWAEKNESVWLSFSPSKKSKNEGLTSQGIGIVTKRTVGYTVYYTKRESYISAIETMNSI